MTRSWDLFFSYRRHDLARARPILEALSAAGVRVWRDETEIPDQASITAEIRAAIGNSKALLAFFSASYLASNPCQQEITAAWLAARQIDGTPSHRVWVVNPEEGFAHLPELLRDQQIPPVSNTTAQQMRTRLEALGTTLLGSGFRELPSYCGMSAVQAHRFLGRTVELWDLHGKLTSNRISIITGDFGQSMAQLRGLGGNGKSLLAREYSIRFGPAYPGGVFWLNAFGNDDTSGPDVFSTREVLRRDQIRGFASRYGLLTEEMKPEEVEARFWQAIAREGKPCLWIIDDLPSGLHLNELERTWNARWAGASTMITTRSREYGALGSVLDLGVLRTSEALDLLVARRQPLDAREELAARQIVALLGCHPLAVEVAASYLAKGFDTFQGYVEALENPSEDTLEFGVFLRESLPTGHERSISATFLKSIRHLGEEGLDFLRLASGLAVAPIRVSLVSRIFALIEGNGNTRAIKGVTQVDALSLCEQAGSEGRAVHTLVSRTIRFHLIGDERTVRLRSAAVEALTETVSKLIRYKETSNIGADLAHARHLAGQNIETELEATLALMVASHDYGRGDYRAAEKLNGRAVVALRRLLGEGHFRTLQARLNHAETLHGLGNYQEARRIQEHVLQGLASLLGAEHPETITAMNNLAQTVSAQGDFALARKIQEQVVLIRRSVSGDEHPSTISALLNLGRILHAQGDFAGSLRLEEHVLNVRRHSLGAQDPDTLNAMNNLAQTLKQLGNLDAARKLGDQVVEGRTKVLGENHPKTLSALINLAETMYFQRDLAGAQVIEQQVLEARERLLGEQHPDTLNAKGNLATTLSAQGRFPEARALQEVVLEWRRRLLGEEHPSTLLTMTHLAETLMAEGHAQSAWRFQEMAVAGFRKVLGEKHPNTLAAIRMLAEIATRSSEVSAETS